MKRNIKAVIAMAVVLVLVFSLMLVRCSCSTSSTDEGAALDTATVIDTTTIINAIQSVSKLYTAEVSARKTLHYESENNVAFTLFGNTKKVKMPFARTTADIPVTITYKAAIDLSKLRRRDVTIIGDSIIRICLPDPIVEETALSVNHDKEKIESQMLAKKLDDATYQKLIKQAESDAWNELKKSDHHAIAETAKVSASEILTPILHELGFKQVDISYRPDFHIIIKERQGKSVKLQ